MSRYPALILTAAAALALTACAPPAPTETTAEVACEDLVSQDLLVPDEATFEHYETTNEDGRWHVSGSVRAEDLVGRQNLLQYQCAVSFEDDGQHYRGHVSYVSEPIEGVEP